MTWFLILLFCYLLGSIPSGFLVARWQGVDIRKHGSGNIGATNVLRVLGKKWGYLVFVCDALKGFLAVRLGEYLASNAHLDPVVGEVIAAVACLLGHNYTCWLGFKGGKGIATSAGILLSLFSPLILLCVAAVWLAFFYGLRYVSLASICAALALPLAVFLLRARTGSDFWLLFVFSVAVALLAVWRHRSNVSRLLQGTESRFGKK